MAARHPDFFTKAHQFIHKLEALVFEIALLIAFLLWVWDKVKHELGF
jgi:hypothetical protein